MLTGSMESLFGLLVFLTFCLTRVVGEIRCYCNESGCISTGYMCKSTIGVCYSLVTYQGETTKTVHGCADSLMKERRTVCNEEGEVLRTNNSPDEIPVLLCCKIDMCNYRENIDSYIILTNGSTKKGSVPHRLLESRQEGNVILGTNEKLEPSSKQNFFSKNTENTDRDKDLWFKAAVIAVPIAGGFILVLLVLLAVRMLRNDSRRHGRLVQIRRERSLTKAQLYVSDHFSEKSNKNCPLYNEKHNNFGKDINIKMDKDGTLYENVCDIKTQPVSHPSIIVWGNSTKSDLATVV